MASPAGWDAPDALKGLAPTDWSGSAWRIHRRTYGAIDFSGQQLEALFGDGRQQAVLVGEVAIRRSVTDPQAARKLAQAEAVGIAFGQDADRFVQEC